MVYYGLLLYLLLEYARPGYYIPAIEAVHLNSLVPLGILLGTMALKTPVSNRESFGETNTKLIAAFLAILYVSLLFATVTERAYKVVEMVFGYALIYWAITRNVADLGKLKGVFGALILVHVIVAAMNPVMFTDPEGRHGITSGAFIGDGNDFALSVNICLPFCLFLLLDSRRKSSKLVWMGVLLLLVLGIVATKSRGGTVALAAMGSYYWLKSERKALMASVFALVVVTVLVAAPPSYFDRMSTITDTEEGSAQGRITAWKYGVQMAMGNPLLGVGAGHFPMAYGQASGGRWMTAHSIYFLVLGELGIPGITVLLALILTNLRANHRLQRDVGRLLPREASKARNVLMCMSASMIAFASGGAFLSAAYYPHLYFLCALHVAARRAVRVQIEEREHAGEDLVPSASGLQRLPVKPGRISEEWRPRPVLGTGRVGGHRW